MLNIFVTIISIIILILSWIMLYDSNRFVVVQHSFVDKRIKYPCRAVILSDLHNKCYGRDNERLLEAIYSQKPDAVFIAGDMITAKPGKKMDIALALLGKLAEKYPIYYANGNHEHRLKLYPQTYGTMADELEKGLQKCKVDRLINQHKKWKDTGIIIYGSEIDKRYYKRLEPCYMSKEYLQQALGTVQKDYYTVLLAHNPDYFPQYAEWGADLVISGHVHGGMVRFPFGRGIVSPAVRLFPKYDGGIFKEGKKVMLLSRGLGMHTIPIRLFNPGEVLVVDFLPEKGI